MSKYDALWRKIAETRDDRLELTFEEAETLAGLPMDHSFLRYKKELTAYGWQVEKISLKERRVRFAHTGAGQ